MSYTASSLVLDPEAVAAAQAALQVFVASHSADFELMTKTELLAAIAAFLPPLPHALALVTWATALEALAVTLKSEKVVNALQTQAYVLRLRAVATPTDEPSA